jgi:Uma2 family endonuclease
MSIREAERKHLEELLRSPRIYEYAREIESALEREARIRREFYEQMTDGEKVEFINGEIIHHSPVRLRHNLAAKHLLVLLDTYVRFQNLGFVGFEKILISLTRNDYEPDLCYFKPEKAADFTPDQMHFPAPDFVVEIISPSTEANDRGIKFEDYAGHGVEEYWIIDPTAETVEQYRLTPEGFELIVKVKDGTVESFVIPGFRIPVQAIFNDQNNRAALQNLLENFTGNNPPNPVKN